MLDTKALMNLRNAIAEMHRGSEVLTGAKPSELVDHLLELHAALTEIRTSVELAIDACEPKGA